MNKNNITDTTDLIAQGIDASVEAAIAEARQHQAPLLLWREGKIIEVSPSELQKIRNEQSVRAKP
jgi:hypothetical protein